MVICGIKVSGTEDPYDYYDDLIITKNTIEGSERSAIQGDVDAIYTSQVSDKTADRDALQAASDASNVPGTNAACSAAVYTYVRDEWFIPAVYCGWYINGYYYYCKENPLV